jgi:seryl-tRNA synthetase
VQKQIGQKKKAKEDANELLAEKTKLEEEKKTQDGYAREKKAAMIALAKTVGNYVHESVPVSMDEENNVVVRTFEAEGFTKGKREALLAHHEVLARLNGYDPVRGAKLAGHRGYCLLGYGMLLNQALVNYGIEFLFQRGYTPNQPPYFLNREQMAKTAQLSQFDEELYHVTESGNEKPENTKYLIATSEQPISCMYSDEWLQPSELPIRFCGYSTCFRKEAGSGGKDTWGIFRIHQFEKVEQFVICKPDDSWKQFEEMILTSEEFYKSLGLSYRVVSM